MKASGSRVRSPSHRGQTRDMGDHGDEERRTNQQQVKDVVGTVNGSGRSESDNRDGGDKRINDDNDKGINDDNVNISTAPEILPVNPVKHGKQSTKNAR